MLPDGPRRTRSPMASQMRRRTETNGIATGTAEDDPRYIDN